MRVLVTGGRRFNDYTLLRKTLDALCGMLSPPPDQIGTWSPPPGTVLIHGGAPGADALADRWAAANFVNRGLPDRLGQIRQASRPAARSGHDRRGLKLWLDRNCDRCARDPCGGCIFGVIDAAKGPHSYGLRCADCGRHRGWLKKAAGELLRTLQAKGWLSPLPKLSDRGIRP
jgi:YspA, cpYpsA-related SLOG family